MSIESAYGLGDRSCRNDGRPRCTNSAPPSYDQECGKVAKWVGVAADGFRACYCDECRRTGYEGRKCLSYEAIPGQPG